jgi:hypothetical protein
MVPPIDDIGSNRSLSHGGLGLITPHRGYSETVSKLALIIVVGKSSLKVLADVSMECFEVVGDGLQGSETVG